MNNNNQVSPQSTRAFLVVAWAQFLAMVSCIDKADMRNVSSAWSELVRVMNDGRIFAYDFTKFGGVSIALVVVAICFLTPSALSLGFGKEDALPDPALPLAFLSILGKIGFYAWLYSFVTFVGYLNNLALIVLFISLVVIGALWIFYTKVIKTDPAARQ